MVVGAPAVEDAAGGGEGAVLEVTERFQRWVWCDRLNYISYEVSEVTTAVTIEARGVLLGPEEPH